VKYSRPLRDKGLSLAPETRPPQDSSAASAPQELAPYTVNGKELAMPEKKTRERAKQTGAKGKPAGTATASISTEPAGEVLMKNYLIYVESGARQRDFLEYRYVYEKSILPRNRHLKDQTDA
jgi:hypothetical protein